MAKLGRCPDCSSIKPLECFTGNNNWIGCPICGSPFDDLEELEIIGGQIDETLCDIVLINGEKLAWSLPKTLNESSLPDIGMIEFKEGAVPIGSIFYLKYKDVE